jgi:hypothetical protein
MRFALLAVATAACGDDNGGRADASLDPPTITISGNARTFKVTSQTAEEPVAAATVTAFPRFDPALATTMTDAQGNFTISIPLPDGEPFDGYLAASKPGFTTTYHFHPSPISTDLVTHINVVTTENFGQLGTSCSVSSAAGSSTIMILALDVAPVPDVTIDTTPAPISYCYNSNGSPAPLGTKTSLDGVAFAVGIPANVGATILNATKAGVTFKAHIVRTFPDSLTTTSITP